MSEQNPLQRINYTGDIGDVLTLACDYFGVGVLTDFDVVAIGYEDCNVIVRTEGPSYFVKIFSSERSYEDIERYVQIVEVAIAAGVSHPALVAGGTGSLYVDPSSGLKMVLMEQVIGQTFLDLARVPSDLELQKILEQVVKVNLADFSPVHLNDIWSISHINETYDSVCNSLSESEVALVEPVIEAVAGIDVSVLPHCLVHGDVIKSNVILSTEKVYLVDFSVTNWAPRIYELAVICGSLMNSDEPVDLAELTQRVCSAYKRAGGNLTDGEESILPILVRASYAMEFLGACKMKFIEGNESDENTYWLELGRRSLERTR